LKVELALDQQADRTATAMGCYSVQPKRQRQPANFPPPLAVLN